MSVNKSEKLFGLDIGCYNLVLSSTGPNNSVIVVENEMSKRSTKYTYFLLLIPRNGIIFTKNSIAKRMIGDLAYDNVI